VTRLKELSEPDLQSRARHGGLTLDVGPFAVRMQTTLPDVAAYIGSHYQDFPLSEATGCHFSVAVMPPAGARRWIRRQAVFYKDGKPPFKPVARSLAPPLLEWGLNWCIGRHAHQWLMLHSSVVERNERVLLMPAPPSSGKSTLGAALAYGGWRLFSDEFGLVDVRTRLVHPLPRPVSLKAASIEIIRSRVPSVRYGPLSEDEDGQAVHLAPLEEAVTRQHEPARVAWIVVPRFIAGASPELEPVPKARMLAHLADSSFNYNVVAGGFDALADIADNAGCYRLVFGRLDDALEAIGRLTGP